MRAGAAPFATPFEDALVAVGAVAVAAVVVAAVEVEAVGAGGGGAAAALEAGTEAGVEEEIAADEAGVVAA